MEEAAASDSFDEGEKGETTGLGFEVVVEEEVVVLLVIFESIWRGGGAACAFFEESERVKSETT